jgi:hypothetical protein
MTVAELLERMSSAEFNEWMAYSMLEPFGPLREDSRSTVAALVVANALRKKDSRAVEAEEFFPQLGSKYGQDLIRRDDEPEMEEFETEDGDIEVRQLPAPGTQLLYGIFPRRPAKKDKK